MSPATKIKTIDAAKRTIGRIHDALRRDAATDGVVSARRLYTATLSALAVIGDFCPECRGSTGALETKSCEHCAGSGRYPFDMESDKCAT